MDQAVADIAVLVSTLLVHLDSPNTTVILWGTGYGASLVNLLVRSFQLKDLDLFP